MSNKYYPLKDRNILIVGSASHYIGGCCLNLCEQGASVAVADEEIKHLSSTAESISSQRELYPDTGKLINIQSSLKAGKESIQKASEYLGGVDTLLVFLRGIENTPITSPDYMDQMQKVFDEELKPIVGLVKESIDFLKAKRKSSIQFIIPEAYFEGQAEQSISTLFFSALQNFSKSLSDELKAHKISVGTIIIGPTEDYLLSSNQGANINSALENYKKEYPKAKLLHSNDLVSAISFLMQPESLNLTSRTLSLGTSV
ncbi:MAG: SDR family NAD(P)-dependent oxidoreductase [Bdellovibrionales bacterium]